MRRPLAFLPELSLRLRSALPVAAAALAALLAVAPTAAGQSRPEIVRFRLADTDTTWVTNERCTDRLADGTRLCRRFLLSTDDDDADSVRFTLERGAERLRTWDVEEGPYQSLGVDLARTDLDGDGRSEHVVAHHIAEGNGLGTRTWTLYVLDDRYRAAAPLHFGSQEHGDDAFVRTPRGMRLLVGSWEDGTDPRRGEGLYFTGRLYRYDGAAGALVPDTDAPVYRRRLLNSFSEERGRTYRREEQTGQRGVPGQTPWRWLQHRATARLRTDPALPPTALLGEEDVVFLGYREHEGASGYAFRRPGDDPPSFFSPLLATGTRRMPEYYAPQGGWPVDGVPARLLLYAPPRSGGADDTGGEPIYVVRFGR